MTEGDGPGVVGRSAALSRLIASLPETGRTGRSAVLVSGTAGMGKTSLIRAAIDFWVTEGAVVGWGTGWPGEGAPGFWPWMQAFDDITRTIGIPAAIEAAGRDRETLSVLARDLGAGPESTGDPDRQRILLLDAAGRWLEALAAARPLVIVLDDLQWADRSTLDLLDYVTSAPLRTRLIAVGAYRHDELDQERQARLGALASHGEHIHLEGLGVDGVEELVSRIRGTKAGRSLAADLHRRTGGHPLFVSELARLSGLDAQVALPTVVTGAVARRLDMLPAGTRSVLDAASVLGNRLLPDVLAAVAGEQPGAVLDCLAPAVDAGLVRRTAGGEFWFCHDLFRETVYSQLGEPERRDLHARVGVALEDRHRRGAAVAPGDLADHFTRAMAVTDPARAVFWAREAAADQRRRSAFGEAAGHLRRVRNAAADIGWAIAPHALVEVLIEEADNQARSGDPDAARGLLATAADIAPTPSLAADVALSVQRLGAKFAAPRDEIITQLESALAAVSGIDLNRQARLTAALARELQHSVAGDRSRVAPLSEQALALGRRSDDDETLVACLLARHDALWEPGTGAERAALGHDIATAGARLGSTDRLAEGLLLEANGLLEAGSAGFRPVLDRWFGLLDARDEARDRYMVLTRRAAMALLDGDAGGAETLMTEAAEAGERLHEPDTGNVLMSQRVALAWARNDPAELTALAGDAVRWWTGAPVLAHGVAAGALAAAGKLADAAREVAVVVEAGGLAGEGSYLRSVLVFHLADAAVAIGDHSLCQSLLDDIEGLTRSCGVNGAVVAFAGPFAYPAGILAAALGRTAQARESLGVALDTARRLGARVWAGRAEAALRAVDGTAGGGGQDGQGAPGAASMTRAGRLWTFIWDGEQAILPHSKGLADLAVLLSHPDQEIAALVLAGGTDSPAPAADHLTDRKALAAYRGRLHDIDRELESARDDADLGWVERLEHEREQLLAEVRNATGIGGRIRINPNDPAERARKAVSARIREAIRRVHPVAPRLGAHLDRSVHTGLCCSYAPAPEDALPWHVRDG